MDASVGNCGSEGCAIAVGVEKSKNREIYHGKSIIPCLCLEKSKIDVFIIGKSKCFAVFDGLCEC